MWSQDIGDASFSGHGLPLARAVASSRAVYESGLIRVLGAVPDGPYTFVAADTLLLKVREQGRVVNVQAPIAVGVDAEGYRELLGIDVSTAEDGRGWQSLTDRGLSAVRLITGFCRSGYRRRPSVGIGFVGAEFTEPRADDVSRRRRPRRL